MAPGGGLARDQIVAGEASLWRYAPALALAGPPRISSWSVVTFAWAMSISSTVVHAGLSLRTEVAAVEFS